MTGEWRIGKGVERRARGLIRGTITALTCRDWRKPWKTSVRVSGPRSEPGTSRIRRSTVQYLPFDSEGKRSVTKLSYRGLQSRNGWIIRDTLHNAVSTSKPRTRQSLLTTLYMWDLPDGRQRKMAGPPSHCTTQPATEERCVRAGVSVCCGGENKIHKTRRLSAVMSNGTSSYSYSKQAIM
jgi:hypothetical protein